jgi:short subunit dehydrogenase-like uncharacterized protein
LDEPHTNKSSERQRIMSDKSRNKSTVAVFGATGHTGKFVVSELLRRGIKPIAIARNPTALAAASFGESKVDCRLAWVDDADSLDSALQGAQAVINCAGPFVDTAEAVAAAALRANIHYLDVCAEQVAAGSTLEKFHKPAQKAGVAVIPSMAFYGGLPDLMASAALGEWDSADSIETMIGLDSWHPTAGTRVTIGRIGTPKVFTGGSLVLVPSSSERTKWDFGPQLGIQALVEVPFSEMVLIPRHVKTPEVRTYLNSLAVSDVLNTATPTPKSADATGRSRQRFVMEVEVRRGGESRRATMRGRDIYAITAPLVCEAVERLLKGGLPCGGAYTPAELFDGKSFLSEIDPEYSTFEVTTVEPLAALADVH